MISDSLTQIREANEAMSEVDEDISEIEEEMIEGDEDTDVNHSKEARMKATGNQYQVEGVGIDLNGVLRALPQGIRRDETIENITYIRSIKGKPREQLPGRRRKSISPSTDIHVHKKLFKSTLQSYREEIVSEEEEKERNEETSRRKKQQQQSEMRRQLIKEQTLQRQSKSQTKKSEETEDSTSLTLIWKKDYDLDDNLLKEEGRRDAQGRYVYDHMPHTRYCNTKEPLYTWQSDQNMKGKLFTGPLRKVITGYRVCRYSMPPKNSPPTKRRARPAIVKYAARGDITGAKSLLKIDTGCVNESCDAYLTALMWASKQGDWDMAHLLILAGADVNREDKQGRTALVFACREGHIKVVELLLFHGVDVNSSDNQGRSPLMMATSKGHIKIVEMLLYCMTIKVDQENEQGRTALMYACRDGHLQCAETLIKAGACIHWVDNFKRNCLMFAAYGAHYSIVKLLINEGIDVRYKSTGLIRWEGGWSSADGWDAMNWAKDQDNDGCIKLIEIRLSQLQGIKYTNNTDGVCSLFSRGRGQTELIECLAYYKPVQLSRLKGHVPNPWFHWQKEDEFPPDFVYPPIPRRHYCF